MARRRLFKFVWLGLALLLCLASSTAVNHDTHDLESSPRELHARSRPDILLVTIDALRADHLSAHGYTRLTSPAIDRFARHAVVFSNAIAQAPYTKAAIGSIMSGLYPTAHKAVTATVPFAETMTGHPTTVPLTTDILSSSIITLAEALKAAGYRTLGFTANPFLIAPFGFGQGFDEFEFLTGDDFAGANRVVDAALNAVERCEPSPVFVWVHLMEPHSPYAPPEWTRGMFPLTGQPRPLPPGMSVPPWLLKGSPRDLRLYEESYDEEIAAADIAFDVLLRDFGDLRDGDNAIVVVTADHGEQFLDHGGWEHNDVLYDELIHVPLLVAAPNAAPHVVKAQVQTVDLYPTLLEFGRAEVPAGVAGRTLRPLLDGAEESAPAFSEVAGVQYAVRVDDWKLIVRSDGRQELFDLRRDPLEQHDALAGEPAKAAQLRRMIDRYIADAMARGRTISKENAPVDPRVLERLRALGYLGR